MKLLFKISLVCTFITGCQDNNFKNKIDDKSITNQETSENHSDLFYTIKSLDSLFFDVAYNKCNSIMGRKLISKDFEFYHDKGGALLDESEELASDIMVDDLSWICNNTYRKLVSNKMEVFPLFNDNELYGAIQTGDHQFYRIENNLPTELEINAKFIHLWVLEGTAPKLKRVFSYDHQEITKN